MRKTRSGETWNVYLDSRTLLPRLVSAADSRGELIERYIYREVHENPVELKTATAFVPDERWGPSNGLLSARCARGGWPWSANRQPINHALTANLALKLTDDA